ncbi:hypothetical protein AYO38_11205 [bacterium SCGC AG-212-C10]|nr:hypothetical protein AYO38_11205 [bacterium SCGC AG-212-C10]
MRIPIVPAVVALLGAAIIAGAFGPWMTDGEFVRSGRDLAGNRATFVAILGALIVAAGLLSLSPYRQWPLGLAPIPAGIALLLAFRQWRDIEADAPAGLQDGPLVDQDAAWGLIVILVASLAVIVFVIVRVASVMFAEDDADADALAADEDGDGDGRG